MSAPGTSPGDVGPDQRGAAHRAALIGQFAADLAQRYRTHVGVCGHHCGWVLRWTLVDGYPQPHEVRALLLADRQLAPYSRALILSPEDP